MRTRGLAFSNSFLAFEAVFLFLPCCRGIERPVPPSPPQEVTVTLVGQTAGLGRETVNFGLPLPPGFLADSRLVRVLGEDGKEFAAAVRPLEPWRMDGKQGTIRSLQIQFREDFTRSTRRTVKILFGQPRTRNEARFTPVQDTLLDPEGLKGPRVLALIPSRWLCDSWVVGPQVPTSDSGPYSGYDQLVERNFPGSLQYIASTRYDHWLFDRTTCWYKMYVRSGEQKFLEAAYQGAHFVRTHTRMEGPDAGAFNPKGSADLKYVYPRAQHIHYLLTGDERSLEAGKIMARLILKNWDPVYHGGFWTPRHEGYGLLGILHGWEMTGEEPYWNKAREYADALDRLQKQPPDGKPPDGSFRENWAQYDPSEAKFEGATSAWMMAILLDPMFHYWTISGDDRVPEMVLKWLDFLDRKGMQPDGRSPYYVINCFSGNPGQLPSTVNGDMTRHDTEMSYQFAMGIYFSSDPARRAVYRKRFDTLYPIALTKDFNQVARSYNWAFQASPQLVYFMQHPGGRP